MANINFNVKQLKINRNQQVSMVAVSIAVIVVVLTISFSSRWYTRMNYQSDVICSLRLAQTVIKANQATIKKLDNAYTQFNEEDERILPDSNADNAVVVLRALPSTYRSDWTRSAWKRFTQNADGTEKYDAQVNIPAPATDNALPPEITGAPGVPEAVKPLQFSIQVNLVNGEDELNDLLVDIDNFIQPVKILDILVNYDDEGNPSDVKLGLQTYIQPPTTLEFKAKQVTDATDDACQETDNANDDAQKTEEGTPSDESDQTTERGGQ